MGDAERKIITSNSVRTAGYISLSDLQSDQYEILHGVLEWKVSPGRDATLDAVRWPATMKEAGKPSTGIAVWLSANYPAYLTTS